MLYTLFSGILIFSIILLAVILFTRISFQMKTLLCGLSMGTFGLLALSSFNITDVYVNSNSVMTHVVLFESWDANAISMLCLLGFIISFIMFVVNVLLSLSDYRTPLWKRRIEEHKRSLGDS